MGCQNMNIMDVWLWLKQHENNDDDADNEWCNLSIRIFLWWFY